MRGGKNIKKNTKKETAKSKPLKFSTTQTTAKTKKKVVSKKNIKKKPQKINLKVRTIANTASNPKKTASVKKAAKNRVLSGKKSKAKKKKLTANVKAKKEKIIKTGNSAVNISEKSKIIVEKTEKDKSFLMWTGVSFFMILIIIFWVYNTAQSLKKVSSEWQLSEKAVKWSQMADNLNEEILKIKNNVNEVREFSNFSDFEKDFSETNNHSLFFQKSSSTNDQLIDSELIEDLKSSLETKLDINKPEDKDFFFIIDDKKREELLGNLEKIKLSDNIIQVKEILKDPDTEEELVDKRGAFIAKVLNYYIKIYKKDLINKKYDQYISLEFDDNDLLIKISKFLD